MNQLHQSCRSPTSADQDAEPIINRYLRQVDLARRWCISPRTLERWRWLKRGPRYLRIGGHVRYRLRAVQRYETASIVSSFLMLTRAAR